MKIEKVKVADKFSTLKKLRDELELPKATNAKQIKRQNEEIARYLKFEKTGKIVRGRETNEIIITEIYDVPLDKIDERKNNGGIRENAGTIIQYDIDNLLLDVIIRLKKTYTYIPISLLYHELKLCNNYFLYNICDNLNIISDKIINEKYKDYILSQEIELREKERVKNEIINLKEDIKYNCFKPYVERSIGRLTKNKKIKFEKVLCSTLNGKVTLLDKIKEQKYKNAKNNGYKIAKSQWLKNNKEDVTSQRLMQLSYYRNIILEKINEECPRCYYFYYFVVIETKIVITEADYTGVNKIRGKVLRYLDKSVYKEIFIKNYF